MAFQMTRLQIINQGLSLAGRPDLLSDARLWLSLFLQDIYHNQDFQWLTKKVSGVSVRNGTCVPVDYRAARSAVLVRKGKASENILFLTDPEDIDEKIMQNGGAIGGPKYAYVDEESKTFKFIPESTEDVTMDLTYYYIPEIGDFDSAVCDDDVPLWDLPWSILVDHIKQRAFEYNDDQRQTGAETQVKNKIMEAKMNNHDRRAGPSRMKLGKRFKKRF